jgi:muramoyltetrapeptide carboxypeptidase LdcA involved in peptidoglycan recycling
MLQPLYLKPWDTIATVSLSWGWPGTCPERYAIGKQQLEQEFWITVIEMPNTLLSAQRVYEHPELRAKDLMDAFANPDIKAIISTIWGEESIRILPYIDFEIIRNNPKIFMWYSDSTITHFICQKAGLVSFYGPSIMAWFGENTGMFPYMIEYVRKSLFSKNPMGVIQPNSDGWTNELLDRKDPENQKIKRNLIHTTPRRWLQWKWIVEGKLIWWCLDVFPFMIGTSIRPSLEERKDKILFIETSEEQMSINQFERILRNLWSQGILDTIKGILLWRSQYNYTNNIQINYDDTLLKIVNKELWLTELSIITNMDFGHTDPMMVLPLWITTKIDHNRNEISIVESACI